MAVSTQENVVVLSAPKFQKHRTHKHMRATIKAKAEHTQSAHPAEKTSAHETMRDYGAESLKDLIPVPLHRVTLVTGVPVITVTRARNADKHWKRHMRHGLH
jgi:hypothetical protein